MSRDLATGVDRLVLDLASLGRYRLVANPGPPPPLMLRTFQYSPDGQQLALTLWSVTGQETEASLAVRGSEAGGIVPVHTMRRLGFHGWSPDGNALFFQAPGDPPTPADRTPPAGSTAGPPRPSSALWWIASRGGVPHPVGLERPGLSTVRISPDARRLTFTAGFDGGEVRVAERLLSR